MDFLTTLYSNENFGIILFTSISILVLIFLVILFFGKKDKKETIAKEVTNIENNQDNKPSEVAFGTIEEPVRLETQVNNEGFEQMEDVPPVPEPINYNASEDLPATEEEIPAPPKTDFDFDALAASISKELESIGIKEAEHKPDEQKEQVEMMEEENHFSNPEVTLYDAPKQETVSFPPRMERAEEEMQKKEPTVISNPSQFSSVYVSNQEEKMEVTPEPMPVNPKIDLPKPIELPKLNTEPSPAPTPVIDENTTNVIFPGLESNQFEENNRM